MELYATLPSYSLFLNQINIYEIADNDGTYLYNKLIINYNKIN